jgi:pimeloyl-ACP methyl ester carboxylesterase
MYDEITGEGEPLVLINGLGLAVSETGPLVEGLARHYRVLAFDNRGAGRTDKPDEPYSIPQMAEDTAGLMRALEFEHAHVVGISLGGRIAIDLALAHPELVRSLVLASTCARVTGRRRVRLLGLMSGLPLLRGSNPQPRYAFKRQLHASDGYDRTARLAQLRPPTLVIHGRRDHIVAHQLAEELAAGVPGARLVTVAGGHIFPLTHPAAFVDHVIAFTGASDR